MSGTQEVKESAREVWVKYTIEEAKEFAKSKDYEIRWRPNGEEFCLIREV